MRFSSRRIKPVAVLIGSAVLLSGGLAAAEVERDAAFAAADLPGGYLLAEQSAAEGKCGEGKCGGDAKSEAEGKCGEGKCGGDGKESAEGKCGEGKCGGETREG